MPKIIGKLQRVGAGGSIGPGPAVAGAAAGGVAQGFRQVASQAEVASRRLQAIAQQRKTLADKNTAMEAEAAMGMEISTLQQEAALRDPRDAPDWFAEQATEVVNGLSEQFGGEDANLKGFIHGRGSLLVASTAPGVAQTATNQIVEQSKVAVKAAVDSYQTQFALARTDAEMNAAAGRIAEAVNAADTIPGAIKGALIEEALHQAGIERALTMFNAADMEGLEALEGAASGGNLQFLTPEDNQNLLKDIGIKQRQLKQEAALAAVKAQDKIANDFLQQYYDPKTPLPTHLEIAESGMSFTRKEQLNNLLRLKQTDPHKPFVTNDSFKNAKIAEAQRGQLTRVNPDWYEKYIDWQDGLDIKKAIKDYEDESDIGVLMTNVEEMFYTTIDHSVVGTLDPEGPIRWGQFYRETKPFLEAKLAERRKKDPSYDMFKLISPGTPGRPNPDFVLEDKITRYRWTSKDTQDFLGAYSPTDSSVNEAERKENEAAVEPRQEGESGQDILNRTSEALGY